MVSELDVAVIADRELQVLILDDDTITQTLIQNMLKKLDVTNIQTAGNGKQGLTILAKSHPDLLLCDLGMPEMDGVEFLQKLSQQVFGGGIILISGLHADMLSGMALLAHKLGLNVLGTLPKPVAGDQLIPMLADFCRQSGKHSQSMVINNLQVG